jgi:hypothetical protein
MDIPRWRWRSREELIQELDARVRIKDIKFVYDLKDAIALRWWEPLLKMLVLVAGICFAVTFIHLLDRGVDVIGAVEGMSDRPGLSPQSVKIVFGFIAGSFSVMLVTGLVSLEILLSRLAAMRRLHEIELKVIEQLQAEIETLRHGQRRSRAAPDPPV